MQNLSSEGIYSPDVRVFSALLHGEIRRVNTQLSNASETDCFHLLTDYHRKIIFLICAFNFVRQYSPVQQSKVSSTIQSETKVWSLKHHSGSNSLY